MIHDHHGYSLRVPLALLLLLLSLVPKHSHLTYKFLSEELYEYLDAAIMVQTCPEEAYRKVGVSRCATLTRLAFRTAKGPHLQVLNPCVDNKNHINNNKIVI